MASSTWLKALNRLREERRTESAAKSTKRHGHASKCTDNSVNVAKSTATSTKRHAAASKQTGTANHVNFAKTAANSTKRHAAAANHTDGFASVVKSVADIAKRHLKAANFTDNSAAIVKSAESVVKCDVVPPIAPTGKLRKDLLIERTFKISDSV